MQRRGSKFFKIKKPKVARIASIVFFYALIIVSPKYALSEDLVYSLEHSPPFFIENKNEAPKGSDIDILQELAKRLDLNLKVDRCLWRRCLKMMKLGQIDMMSDLTRTAEREEYMRYLEPPYRTTAPKVFYIKADAAFQINKYEDIYSYSVGTVDGNKYFEPFDNDAKINKVFVNITTLLPKMLKKGRFDLYVGSETTMDYIISSQGLKEHIKKSNYRFDEPYNSYFAISRKSKHFANAHKFDQVLREMIKEGIIKEAINKYIP